MRPLICDVRQSDRASFVPGGGALMSILIEGASSLRTQGMAQSTNPAAMSRAAAAAHQVDLAGTITDLLHQGEALEIIIDAARNRSDEVLGVVSVNLDHVHHFGTSQGSPAGRPASGHPTASAPQPRWLNLLDGAPLVKRAGQLTGCKWPRLAGSDLIEPLLDQAELNSLTVGFLGGSAATHAALAPGMRERWPSLRVSGYWAPDRDELTDPAAAQALTDDIARADVDILIVCLGKPRQENWIAEYGYASGARVCLAFGAVVDFLAGRVARAPSWVADRGLEWTWRLVREPRRLARRYLVQGGPAYLKLQRNSHVTRSLTIARS